MTVMTTAVPKKSRAAIANNTIQGRIVLSIGPDSFLFGLQPDGGM